MKFKFFVAAALFLGLAVGCEQEHISYLSEIQLSKTYASIVQNGGYTTVEVNATDRWQVDAATVPAWLTVSPMEGGAGAGNLTFSAEETSDTRTADIKINCAGKTQLVKIVQQAEQGEIEIISVDKAVSLIKAGTQGTKLYYVKGIVCQIKEIDTGQYGNATFWLSDDGTMNNTLQVYRGYWIDGVKFTDPNAFSVGDELIVSGVLIDYQGTPETEQYTASVVAVNKSLIKCDSLVFNGVKLETLPIEGGDFDAALSCKGDGVSVSVPDDAKSWLSVIGVKTSGAQALVTFRAAKNEGGDRSTELTFYTSSEGKDYSAVASVAQKGSILEVSIAEFNAAAVGETQYRVSGMVTSIAKADYGNIYIRDWSAETYIYGIGAKGDFAKTGIKVGDIITVVGKRGAYGTTVEMLNTVVENVISVNFVDFPTFIAAEKSKDVYYRLTGTITNIEKADYGNLYIEDEAGNEVYVYGLYPGYGAQGDARKGLIAEKGIEVGDVLTVEGYKDVYKDKIELCGGVYVSHEKGGGDDVQPVGDNLTISLTDLPSSYPTTPTNYTINGYEYSILNVANYGKGDGIQMKKSGSYISNVTPAKRAIVSVRVDARMEKYPEGAQYGWDPSNLKLYVKTAADGEEVAIAGEKDATGISYALEAAKGYKFFTLKNESSFALYLEQIVAEITAE